jgi:hypothetical protein
LVTVQVSLNAASAQEVTVPIVYSGTATSGLDYSNATSSIRIQAGQTGGSVSFEIVGDSMVESNETIILTMGNPTNAKLGAITNYTHTITNDDLPSIQFSTTSGSNYEGNSGSSTVAVEASLSTASAQEVTVPIKFSGTASVGSDYTDATTTITIAPGKTSGIASFVVVGDKMIESDETVILTIGEPTNAVLGASTTFVYTITSDDLPAVNFYSSSSSENEGNSGSIRVIVEVTLSAITSQAVTVPVFYSGTATLGTDYSSSATSITIGAGQTTGSASFSVIGDTTLESNETVILTMGTPTNATLGANTSYTHTITNDDVPTVQFASSSGASNEGNSGISVVTVQATLSAASTQAVTVPVTYSGTATSGTDHSSATTNITIAAGQTTGSASFSIIGDTTLESNETVILTMATPTNATLGANTSYTHTIVNDDLIAGSKSLGSVAYHWKSHALLSGVTVSTGDQKAVQADSDLFDLRAASFDAASGTLTVQLWVNPVQASMSFDVSAVTQGAKSASFTPSLSASTWTVLANTDKPNDVSISGFLSNPSAAGVTGALQLGTLTMVLTPNAPVAVSFKNLSVGNSTSADVNLTLASASTDASGAFALALPDGSYGLTVSRAVGDGSNNNGVTSADALAALKIAVGMNPNTDPDGSGPLQTPMLSPYQVMAADVNGDGRVTSADALAILKMSVKLADAPAPGWMFVEEDRDFWDEATKAFTLTRSNAAWDAQIKVSLPADAKTNLVGVLKGDVNGSWTLAGASTLEATNPTYFKDLAQLIGVPADQWGIPPGG